MLGPSTDMYDESEDFLTVVGNISFIADKLFLNQYGAEFELLFEENRLQVRQVGLERPAPSTTSC